MNICDVKKPIHLDISTYLAYGTVALLLHTEIIRRNLDVLDCFIKEVQ